MLHLIKSKEMLNREWVNNLYAKNNLPKTEAEKYMTLLKELIPGCDVHVEEGDENLYRLGFISEITCTLKIGISYKEAEQLCERLSDMESDAYCNEDIFYKSYSQLNERERNLREAVLGSVKRYERYECLQAILFNYLSEMEK